MGMLVSTFVRKVSKIFSNENSWSIIIIGLANAGKTSFAEILKKGFEDEVEEIMTEPTIGHSVETIKYKSASFHVWDLSGQDKLQLLWPNYYLTADAVVFMVDSNDPERFPDAKRALESLLYSEDLTTGAPVLILANKQDLLSADSRSNAVEYFDVGGIKERPIKAFPCVVKSREGIEEAMEWLLQTLQHRGSNGRT